MKRRALAVVGSLLAASFIAAGCGDDGGGDDGGSSSFDGTMKVGAIVPLTGDLSSFGAAGEQGLELAVDQANEALAEAGLEGEVELVVEDGETAEGPARAAAEKLVREDEVSCIVGDWASSSTEAVANSVTIDEGVPLISPASTAGTITELDDDGTVFRTVPSDNLQAEVLAEAIAEDLGGEGDVTVAARNNTYGQGLAEAFVTAGEEAGLTVREPILMDPDTAQARSEAEDITAEPADAYLIIDYPNTWVELGPALARTGDWDPAKTWGSDGMRDETLPSKGEEITEGMRGTAPTSAEAPAAEAFDALWKENVDIERQTYDADNFDAVMACVLAAVAADSSDPADVAAELQNVSGPEGETVTFENLAEGIELLVDGEQVNYEGAASPLDWDENGDPQSAFYEIWSYEGGKLGSLETIPYSAGDTEAGVEEGGDALEEDGAETDDAATDDAATDDAAMEDDAATDADADADADAGIEVEGDDGTS